MISIPQFYKKVKQFFAILKRQIYINVTKNPFTLSYYCKLISIFVAKNLKKIRFLVESRIKKRNFLTYSENLVRYRNRPDGAPHQLRTAMHHYPQNCKIAVNMLLILVLGLGKFSRVESN